MDMIKTLGDLLDGKSVLEIGCAEEGKKLS